MSDLSDKTALIYDHGVFPHVAHRLSRGFGRVLYHKPFVTSAMRMKDWQPGFGYDTFEKVDSFWRTLGDLDPEHTLIVFPDVNDGDLQVTLSELGWRVWGCFGAEELEINRWETRSLMKKMGMPLIPALLIQGIDELEKHLHKVRDKWIKLSRFRGDMDTWKHIDWFMSEPRLRQLRVRWGAMANQMEFIVEDDLPDAVEIGYDGWCIRGEFPSPSIIGYEMKGKSYVGVNRPYEKLPEPVKWVNAKFAPVLANYGYSGFWSIEIRVTEDGTPYVIDPCARAGSPPSEVYCEWVDNLPEIMWSGSEGIVVTPVFKSQYASQLMLSSDWSENFWCPVQPGMTDRVKLRFPTRIDGNEYVVPQFDESTDVGAVIGFGDTLKKAIKDCQKNAETVRAYDLEFNPESLDEAIGVVDEGRHYGIEF